MQKIMLMLIDSFCSFTFANAQMSMKYVPCNDMPNVMQNYYADVIALERVYIVKGSPEKRERYKKLSEDYLSKLKGIDFNSLPQECKADYVLFKRDLNEEVYRANKEATSLKRLEKWFPFADSIYALEKIRRRGGKVNGQNVAADFSNIDKGIQQLQSKLSLEKSLTIQDEGSAQNIIEGFQIALNNVFSFYNAYDPIFTWWVPVTYQKLDSTLKSYSTTFKTVARENAPNKDSSGIVGYPIGRDEIVRQLNYELIDYSPEELIQIANKEFAWCDKEMIKASQEMGFGNDWKKALEKVKQSYVPAGDQPAAMMKLYDESVAFLKEKDLITIPPLAEETWRIVMMSPQQQLLNPFFYGGEEFSISYPTNSMDYDAKLMSMRGNNPHFHVLLCIMN